jgi:hypothetical protein
MPIVGFATCASQHMVTVGYYCKGKKIEMNNCFRKHGTLEAKDRAREEWFRIRDGERAAKRKELEDTEKRKQLVRAVTDKYVKEEEERQKEMQKGKQGSIFGSWW